MSPTCQKEGMNFESILSELVSSSSESMPGEELVLHSQIEVRYLLLRCYDYLSSDQFRYWIANQRIPILFLELVYQKNEDLDITLTYILLILSESIIIHQKIRIYDLPTDVRRLSSKNELIEAMIFLNGKSRRYLCIPSDILHQLEQEENIRTEHRHLRYILLNIFSFSLLAIFFCSI